MLYIYIYKYELHVYIPIHTLLPFGSASNPPTARHPFLTRPPDGSAHALDVSTYKSNNPSTNPKVVTTNPKRYGN